jgi:heterodisulfide reductase subunit A-like polyferredoxin
MEAKAHSRETYKTDGKVSWMEQDLLDYSSDLRSSYKSSPTSEKNNAILRDKRKNLHVCVVGAGFAGLRCVDMLIEGGVKVTVLEARNRIGGRVSLLRPVLYMEHLTSQVANKTYRSIK